MSEFAIRVVRDATALDRTRASTFASVSNPSIVLGNKLSTWTFFLDADLVQVGVGKITHLESRILIVRLHYSKCRTA